MASTIELDELMRRGWMARSEVRIDGWIARLSGGVTQRANSVLPVAAPPHLEVAVDWVESVYHACGLAPTFQISPASQPAELDDALARRGYAFRDPTVVHVADVDDVMRRISPSGSDVRVLDAPDQEWMDLWWSIDGRGGNEARAIATNILTAGPASYATTRDADETVAVGRLALVGGWAGLYCLAVRSDARRRGHASLVLRALLQHATERGVRHAWLQVMGDNAAARELYERVGFTAASSYHYRTLDSGS